MEWPFTGGYEFKAVVCMYAWFRDPRYNLFGVLQGQASTKDHTASRARTTSANIEKATTRLVELETAQLSLGPRPPDTFELGVRKWRHATADEARRVNTAGSFQGSGFVHLP